MTIEQKKYLAWTITNPGELTQAELYISAPGPRQALIRIEAFSLNFRDHLVVQHSPAYPVVAQKGLVPGSDGAGTIVAAGSGSSWAKRVGENVFVLSNTWDDGDVGDSKKNYDLKKRLGAGNVHGTFRQYIVMDDEYILAAPKGLGPQETSTLMMAGLTAWNALFEGPVKPGPGVTILTQGTGGVSVFALQLAAAAGATVIATSSSDEKLEVAKKLGAQHVVNYRKTPNWAEEVLRITDGRGVDHVVDVAGAGTVEQSLQSARLGGLVSVIGVLTESKKADLIPQILFGSKTIRGVLGSGSKAMAERLVEFAERQQLRPVIARVFEFSQVPEAFAQLAKQSEIGKLVVRV